MENISLGSWITLNHPSIAEILSECDFDWLCIDMEHSAIDYFEAKQLISAIQSKGKEAYVRVGGNNKRIIKRVLDAGADGIIIPMVNCRLDAENAISYANYPPNGTRGVGLSRAQLYGFGFEDYKNNKAKNIKVIVQIEHVDAIENLDDILSLDGIYGSLIGPYDLSGSMGKPGMYDDDDVKHVLSKYELIAKKYNKKIGFHVIEPEYQRVKEKINQGYNLIAFSLDTVLMGTIAREQLSLIKNKI